MTDTEWPGFEDVIDPEAVPIPGSRPRVQHARKEEKPPASERPWQDYPHKVYRVNGQDMELFRIGALAAALNRRPSVVKEWEAKGWLPKTSLRFAHSVTRSRIKTKAYVAGTPIRGTRLYTRAFIEGIAALAEETGVHLLGVYVGETDFPQRARDLYYETMPGEPE